MTTVQGKSKADSAARVLVVDDEPEMQDLVRDVVLPAVDCEMAFASTVAEARRILGSHPIDLLVADIHLPDGDGLSLLHELTRLQPSAAAVVISGEPSVDGAITALREGAVDFVRKPFSADDLARRVRKALHIRQLRLRQELRLAKLRDAVHRLNAARKVVNKKVDLLCNDLISAYSELSRQLDSVRVQEGFRNFLATAADLEQMLCHTMDFLLRQVGYCNIGIWLSANDNDLQLGAFMKYTQPAEADLVEALQANLLRVISRRNFVRLRDSELDALLTPTEGKYLRGQDVLGINCTYLGESLAVMILFRDRKTPFSEDDMTALKTVAPLFALSLARSVKGGQASEEQTDGPGPDQQGPDKPKSRKKDPADWWKRGEDPPF